jgi:hypothetical protein
MRSGSPAQGFLVILFGIKVSGFVVCAPLSGFYQNNLLPAASDLFNILLPGEII